MFYSQAFLGNVAIILFSITLGLQILLVSINGNLTFLVKFINFSSYHLNGFDCKLESVHNFSNFILRAEDLELLKYGLKHPIHSLQVNKTYILTTFDFIHHEMNRDVRDEKQSGEVKTKISYLAHWCVKCVNYHKLTLHVLKKH